MVGHFASVVSMLLIWFLASLTLWAAAGAPGSVFMAAGKTVYRASRRSREFSFCRGTRISGSFQFAFLLFLVLVSIAFMSSVYCAWFCPFKLVTEFTPVIDIPSLIEAVFFIGAFLGLVIVLPFLTRKRFQCSAFCPFGRVSVTR